MRKRRTISGEPDRSTVAAASPSSNHAPTPLLGLQGMNAGVAVSDLIVAERVIVELKCARTIDSHYEARLLNYLKATSYEVGLLLNFGNRPHFRRMVLQAARKRPWPPSSSESKTHSVNDRPLGFSE